MGEGLAIGFDGAGAATVVGTPMAHLLGATEHFELPNSRIGVNIPTEKLFHVNGTPREEFVPPVLLTPSDLGEPSGRSVGPESDRTIESRKIEGLSPTGPDLNL